MLSTIAAASVLPGCRSSILAVIRG